jgi:hypothetical protein
MPPLASGNDYRQLLANDRPVRIEGMNRTYAPKLLDRLDYYAAVFRDDFIRPRQTYSGV